MRSPFQTRLDYVLSFLTLQMNHPRSSATNNGRPTDPATIAWILGIPGGMALRISRNVYSPVAVPVLSQLRLETQPLIIYEQTTSSDDV